jgi:glycosyltransferase involved in cell wall biosynthesis
MEQTIKQIQNPRFTVFTPSYNRARTLDRVYSSLKNQTFESFEWVIVDDGSKDNTADLVRSWILENKVCIRFFTKPNQGKHTALNRGIAEARGELFVTVDSDDECLPEALERFNELWNEIPDDQKNEFSGLAVNCKDQFGNFVGKPFPKSPLDSNAYEIRTYYNVTGDKFGCNRVAVLREFPFPEIPNEKYLPEDLVWNRMGRKYKIRFVNEILRVYHLNEQDSLARSAVKLLARDFKGATTFYNEYSALPITLVKRLKGSVNYLRYSLHGKRRVAEIVLQSQSKSLIPLSLFPAFFFYLRDKKRFSKQK